MALISGVVFDYPRENEMIRSGHYAFRIMASDGIDDVEVAIDGGAWQPCRRSHGVFWYDWIHFPPGRHEIVAQAKSRGRVLGRTPARRVWAEDFPAD